MQHWNSFSTLYTPFQSYFLPVNHILLVRVGKTGQYWWVIVYNSLRTHDLHQYKSFFILCYLRLNPYHRVAFERSLIEVSKEVNMWNPVLFTRGKQTNPHIWYLTLRWHRGEDISGLSAQLGNPGSQISWVMFFSVVTRGHKSVWSGQQGKKTSHCLCHSAWKSCS